MQALGRSSALHAKSACHLQVDGMIAADKARRVFAQSRFGRVISNQLDPFGFSGFSNGDAEGADRKHFSGGVAVKTNCGWT
jgi:hypothetical protein